MNLTKIFEMNNLPVESDYNLLDKTSLNDFMNAENTFINKLEVSPNSIINNKVK